MLFVAKMLFGSCCCAARLIRPIQCFGYTLFDVNGFAFFKREASHRCSATIHAHRSDAHERCLLTHHVERLADGTVNSVPRIDFQFSHGRTVLSRTLDV